MLDIDTSAADELAAALADDLPLLKRDGGFIRPGYALELDELRELQRDSRRFIAALQARYAAETGCRTLRVKHNHMIGYFVEVPQNVGEDLLATLEGDVRPPPDHGRGHALLDHRTRRAGSEDRLRGRPQPQDRARDLRRAGAATSALADQIAAAADATSAVDVTAALADLATRLDWVAPAGDG